MIVAVFAEPDSPLVGLRNLIMPIRASNIHYNDLLHVVIIGDADYLKSKFKNFCLVFRLSVSTYAMIFLSYIFRGMEIITKLT